MATFKRVTVTPAGCPPVCPRLLGFLTTLTFAARLTFGAQRRNHRLSTAFETIAKKTHRDKEDSLSTCDQQFVVSRTQPKLEGKCVSVGVDALAVARVTAPNTYLYFYINFLAGDSSPLRFSLISKTTFRFRKIQKNDFTNSKNATEKSVFFFVTMVCRTTVMSSVIPNIGSSVCAG